MKENHRLLCRKTIVVLGMLCLMGNLMLRAETMTAGISSSVVMDGREDVCGKTAHGVAAVSVYGDEHVAGTVSVDGKTVENPAAWDSSTGVTVNASVKRGKETMVTAKVKLPAMLPGEWQVQVAANQFRDVYEGGKVDNNTLLSEEAFTLKMDELSSGTSTVAVPSGASQIYRLSAVADGGTTVWLESASEADLTVVASNGRIPTAQEYHWKGVAVAGLGWLLEIPKGTTGDVFVTLMNGSEEHTATVDMTLDGRGVDMSTLEFGDVVFGSQTVDAIGPVWLCGSGAMLQSG